MNPEESPGPGWKGYDPRVGGVFTHFNGCIPLDDRVLCGFALLDAGRLLRAIEGLAPLHGHGPLLRLLLGDEPGAAPGDTHVIWYHTDLKLADALPKGSTQAEIASPVAFLESEAFLRTPTEQVYVEALLPVLTLDLASPVASPTPSPAPPSTSPSASSPGSSPPSSPAQAAQA